MNAPDYYGHLRDITETYLCTGHIADAETGKGEAGLPAAPVPVISYNTFFTSRIRCVTHFLAKVNDLDILKKNLAKEGFLLGLYFDADWRALEGFYHMLFREIMEREKMYGHILVPTGPSR